MVRAAEVPRIERAHVIEVVDVVEQVESVEAQLQALRAFALLSQDEPLRHAQVDGAGEVESVWLIVVRGPALARQVVTVRRRPAQARLREEARGVVGCARERVLRDQVQRVGYRRADSETETVGA